MPFAKLIESIEGAKKEVEDKVSHIKIKAHQQMEMLKTKAVIQAGHTRKTAASAAWWLTPAVTSAGAAMLDGII